MADKKISQLTGATTPVAGTEVLPIVQGGSTVKVSIANLTAGRSISSAGGSLDGAVTINESGADVDMRVEGDTDANLLFVDASTDRIGVGVNNPAAKFHVSGQSRVADSSDAAKYMTFGVGANAPYGNASISTTTAGLSIVAEGAGNLTIVNNGVEGVRINSNTEVVVNENSENLDFRVEGDTDANLLFVDASTDRIGVGENLPNTKVTILGPGTVLSGSTTYDLQVKNSSTAYGIRLGQDGTNGTISGIGTSGLTFWTYNGSAWGERLKIDSSGNLGLGVTPFAWTSTYKAFDIGAQGSLYYAAGYFGYTNNSYWNGANIYKADGYASDYYTQNGAHVWRTAPSGIAGNTISFTTAMVLDASGQLGIGAAAPAEKLEVAGNLRFSGSQVGTKIQPRQTAISVTTSATTIVDNAGAYGSVIIVNGEAGGDRFCDLLFASTAASPTVIASFAAFGSPAARTYTRSAGALQLAMASGTYDVYALVLGW